MSYFVYKDEHDVLRCNQCLTKLKRNKHGKMPKLCPSCQASLRKSPADKIAKILVNVQACPKCKHAPTLLNATDYSFTDNAYAYHRITCLNCGGLKTNLHYSLEGVEQEWNDLVKEYKE